MKSMRRHVASTSLRRHVPAGNSAPLAPPPNILNLAPPPQYSKPSYAYDPVILVGVILLENIAFCFAVDCAILHIQA